MINQSTREMTAEERRIFSQLLPSRLKRMERFATVWVLMLAVIIVPLIYGQKDIRGKWPLEVMLAGFAGIAAVTFLISYFIYRKSSFYRFVRSVETELSEGKVNVIQLTVTRAIRRSYPFGAGQGYYLEVGEDKVYFMQNRDLEELEEKEQFPNSEVEIVEPLRTNFIISLRLPGTFILPERELPPFSNEEFKSGNIHYNGQVLDISLDSL